jgi:hypothetical protein
MVPGSEDRELGDKTVNAHTRNRLATYNQYDQEMYQHGYNDGYENALLLMEAKRREAFTDGMLAAVFFVVLASLAIVALVEFM